MQEGVRIVHGLLQGLLQGLCVDGVRMVDVAAPISGQFLPSLFPSARPADRRVTIRENISIRSGRISDRVSMRRTLLEILWREGRSESRRESACAASGEIAAAQIQCKQSVQAISASTIQCNHPVQAISGSTSAARSLRDD